MLRGHAPRFDPFMPDAPKGRSLQDRARDAKTAIANWDKRVRPRRS